MRQVITIVGIILIIGGIVCFGLRYTYYTPENVAQIGPIKVTASQPNTFYFPPAASGIAVVAGLVLVIIGRIKNR
jgi:hypothetical protein